MCALAEVVLYILGENNATISGVGQDSGLVKLQIILNFNGSVGVKSPNFYFDRLDLYGPRSLDFFLEQESAVTACTHGCWDLSLQLWRAEGVRRFLRFRSTTSLGPGKTEGRLSSNARHGRQWGLMESMMLS